jgi:hypothetical protein
VVAHLHSIKVEDWIPDQLSRTMIRHLPTTLGDVEGSTDVLHLAFLRVERVGVGRVVSSAGGVCGCVFWGARRRGGVSEGVRVVIIRSWKAQAIKSSLSQAGGSMRLVIPNGD